MQLTLEPSASSRLAMLPRPQSFLVRGAPLVRPRRRLLIHILCAAASVASFGGAAAHRAAGQSIPTLKVQTEVVNVYAVVMDKHGHIIPNLTKEDFRITDDGVPQQISYFARAADTPLTLGMMIDTSPSQQNVLPLEQRQAAEFLREVMRPKDMAFVLHFDLTVELLQDFTANLQSLIQAIDETTIRGAPQVSTPSTFPSYEGYTHLYDAVWLACSPQLMATQIGRKVLILMTDGQDEGSHETLKSAIESAQRADTIIYSIDIVDPAMYRTYYVYGGGYIGGTVLRKMAQATGGEFLRVGRHKDTSAAFQKIARELRTQYLLGFSPVPRGRPGSFHQLRVTTINKHYRVHARQGYYALSPAAKP